MSEWYHSVDAYEEAKMLMRKIHGFFQPDIEVIYDFIRDIYEQGYEDGKASREAQA